MKMLRILIFGVVALAQLAVPATMVWQRDQTLKQGRIWKFRTAPVDPVDVIRGRYIALRFTAEEFAATIRMPTSQFACAVGTQPSISSTSITSRYLSISARIRRNEQNRFARLAIFCSHRPVAGRPI